MAGNLASLFPANLVIALNKQGVIMKCVVVLLCIFTLLYTNRETSGADRDLVESDDALFDQAAYAIILAGTEFAKIASTHDGYVYRVSSDGKQRWGEGEATPTEIWVQPPGTPTVGMALLAAYNATGDERLLSKATAAAEALVFGQLKSGAWADRVDFDPKGKRSDLYRNGKGNGKGRNYSTLDDDKSQAAIRFLIEMDKAHKQSHAGIHDAIKFAMDSLLKAQFSNGGFPQGWEKPVESFPVKKASFPTYDWRTEGRVKDYWNYETLNDGLAGTVASTLWLAYETYQDDRYRDALLRFGDFLILAQLPEPQPAWAQQYNHDLVPIWARKFEPAAVVGTESEDVIATLMFLTEKTGEQRFLEPIPAAIAWLKRSTLADGQLARFYELETNKPLYMFRRGDVYTLTYDDSDLPTHYGFKSESKLEKLEERYKTLASGATPRVSVSSLKTLRKDATTILAKLDAQGRWLTDEDGKESANGDYLDSKLFSKNISRLAEYVTAVKKARDAK